MAMRRTLYRLFTAIALLVAVATGWLFLRPQPPVTVSVVNVSHKPIAWVKLQHEKGVEMLGKIPAGQSRVIKFHTRGETSYTLAVRFEDGTELSGKGSYAEAGYSFTESITDSGVTNELQGMRY
jgi:hypothetical protein